jgi:predicted porin
MRESQMKKIIALAVAGAFVAPVYAADVTISGDMEFQIKSADGSDTEIRNDDNVITVSATSEGNNGLTFSADMNYKLGSANGDGGESISVAGPFGKLSVGDNSGALDNTGDWTDVAPELGGFEADGNDHGVLFTTDINGVAFAASYSPSSSNVTGGVKDDARGVSVTYTMGNVSVYAGQDSYESSNVDVDTTAYGLKYTAGPLMVAVESGSIEDAAANQVDYTGVAVTYKMGDLTVGYEGQTDDAKGGASVTITGNADATADSDLTIFFAKYSLGGGATVYVESGSDSKATNSGDTTTVGLAYSF